MIKKPPAVTLARQREVFFDRLRQPSDLPMAAVLSSCDFYAHFGTGLIENLCLELPAF